MSDYSVPYAKVGGPPDNWQDLQVFDKDTGIAINHVIECNAVQGWAKRYLPQEYQICGPDDLISETIFGNFIIRDVKSQLREKPDEPESIDNGPSDS